MVSRRKTSLLALGAMATLMALAPTAVNADAYGDTAHSCEYVNKVTTCQKLTNSDTCGADTNCLWYEDSFCDASHTLGVGSYSAIHLPQSSDEYTAVSNADESCSEKNAEADCTGSCEWITATTTCIINEATVKEKVTNALTAFRIYRDFKCKGSHVTEAACDADSKCEWARENTECTGFVFISEYSGLCANVSPASRLTKVSAVVSAVFVAALASLA
jgi:hypothetical protein